MTGWNEHGHAVMTGLPVDKYLGHGDLQDAENCGYAPVSVLAELGIDRAHGDPQVQYRDGRIVLTDGTVLERGGTLNCVWAVTRLPGSTPVPEEPAQPVDLTKFDVGRFDEMGESSVNGELTVPRELVDLLDERAGKKHSIDGPVLATLAEILARYDSAAYARGVSEGLRRADNAINWQTSCLGCAEKLDESYAGWCKGHEAGLAEGQAERDLLRRLHEATEAALEQAEQYARDLQDNLAIVDSPLAVEQPEAFAVLVDQDGRCGCCPGTGEHPCGHECDSCDGSGRDPDSPPCRVPHGGDCKCAAGQPEGGAR